MKASKIELTFLLDRNRPSRANGTVEIFMWHSDLLMLTKANLYLLKTRKKRKTSTKSTQPPRGAYHPSRYYTLIIKKLRRGIKLCKDTKMTIEIITEPHPLSTLSIHIFFCQQNTYYSQFMWKTLSFLFFFKKKEWHIFRFRNN